MPIFYDNLDYWRMLKLLYIANNTKPFNMSSFHEKDIFEINRSDTLVDIIAYCLMPNHIHITARSESDYCVAKFMQKLCTGYSMYFNKKYDHSGTIWQGSYKKKISDYEIDYMKVLIRYIHLNPYGIKEPNMTKEARKEHPVEAWQYSINYEFSSLIDYLSEVKPRSQTPILCQKELEKWRYQT